MLNLHRTEKKQLQFVIFLRRQNPPNIIRIKPVGCHKAPFTALMFFHNYVNDRLQGQNQSAGIFDLFSGQLMKKSAILFSGPSTGTATDLFRYAAVWSRSGPVTY